MSEVTIGVCGLGNMGLQVARRAATVRPGPCFDVSEAARANAAAEGLQPTAELSDLSGCDVVVLCLPRSDISLDVARRLAGLLEKGSVVIETSTVSPNDIAAMEAYLEPKGIRVIDAAIISGVPAMAAGTSTMLVGADEHSAGELVVRIINALSAKVTWLGRPRAAMAMKVIHNAVAHATMVTLSEARAMGLPYGITEEMLVEMLRGEEAGLLRPLLHRIGERVPARDYAGGMSLEAARKDSLLALAMAAEWRVPLYSIGATHTAFENAVGRFSGRDDYAVIAELWARPEDGERD
ncbi:NAD(P)-dependent oxidoreductase [Streptomyces nigra]|uniref:NAD(P)-dependent oxidoreductase n=1 Tax=Streptomyces nigra TaxID=1827580 RepID=UPI0036761576